ncbi:peptide chain release factor N(5)-glutamine methyltransferase [Jutongia sp.]
MSVCVVYRELLEEGKRILAQAEIVDAECDAWLLLEHASGMNRAQFFLHQQDTVPGELETDYREMLRKRAEHIPLQHLTGTQEFMGLEFQVSPDVLIPRQDTEPLVEKLLPHVHGKRVLDVCTGSGCIAISLAVLGKPEQMDAVDLSERALIQAEKNAKRLGADISFYRSDMLDEITGRYDVIVSNPPYIASGVVDELMPEVQEHEPRMALDGGADGLDLYRRLLAQAPERLLPGGLLAVEIGYDQREAVIELFREQGFTDVHCDRDLCGNDRVVMGRYQ